MRILLSLLLATVCFAQGKKNVIETGTINGVSSNRILPTYTFASPPSSPPTGAVYVFTDAAISGGCAGTGSAFAICRWSGSVWQSLTDKGNAQTISLQVAGCSGTTAGSALDLPTTNAPAPTCHGTTYTSGTLDYDHSASEKASFSFRLPTGWTGAIDIGLDWYTSATSGSNKWTIETACLVEGTTAAGSPSFNSAQTVTTTSAGTTNVLTRSAQASVTTTGCGAGDIIIFRIGRDVSDTNTAIDSLQNIDVTVRVTPQA